MPKKKQGERMVTNWDKYTPMPPIKSYKLKIKKRIIKKGKPCIVLPNWIDDKLPKKKQPVCRQGRHYIYVARLENPLFHIKYLKSFTKIKKDKFGFNPTKEVLRCKIKPFYNINLKKGEQKRIPISVDKAEKV